MSKQKLVEKFIVNNNEYSQVTTENLTEKETTVIVEEKKGEKIKYKAEAIYTFPVSRPGEKNLNERVYPKKLWEKVIKEKQAENSFGLMDHPEGEGSTKDNFCVWRNIRFSEDKKLVLADAYLFGHWGRQVKEALEAGGKIGLSTSGFGEFEEDGMTVKAESFELERVADHVLQPSYSVFGSEENRQNKPEEDKKEESVLDQAKIIKESNEPEKEEKIMNKMTSFEEKSFRLNMESQIKEVFKIENLDERQTALEGLLEYFEDDVAVDLKEKINTEINSVKEQLKELAKKGSQLDALVEESKKELSEKVVTLEEEKTSLQEQSNDVSDKLEKSLELLDSLKVYSNKMKEMYEVAIAEKNGMVTASEYKEALIYVENLEEEKEKLQKKLNELKEELREELREKVKNKRKFDFLEKKKKCEDDDEDEDDDDDDSDDDSDDEDKEEKSKKKKKKKEDFSGIPSEIVEYYLDLEYSNPAVTAIKNDILKARTLIEAQRTYLRLKSLLSSFELPERYEQPRDNKKLYRKSELNKDEAVRKLNKPEGWV